MKNIINISKRGIIAILILCTILGVSGTSVYAATMVGETTVATEETAVATKEPTQEFMPMMAKGCSSVPTNYSLYYPDGRIYANVHFDHSHGGMQPHVHVYTWHQGPNGCWNSSRSCVAYDPALYPRP